jgi:trehalose 6-phosphate synthase
VIVVSHRGPLRYEAKPDGGFDVRPGAGGVVSSLTPLLKRRDDVTWIAAAISADDRAAVNAGDAPELLALDPAEHHLAYDLVSNGVLWFLFHGLFDLVRRPRFDAHFREAWNAYRSMNEHFAAAVVAAAAKGDVVLVQDFHFALLPAMLRAQRPDLKLTHFTHTPFCGPNSVRILPDDVGVELCTGMAAAPCGFNTDRWARAFTASTHEVAPSTDVDTFSAPIGPDADSLRATAEGEPAKSAARELAELVGDRKLLLRSDRIEPSKNIVRGFLAYDHLLESHPDLQARVVFVAMLNPSRDSLAEYQAYRAELEHAAERVNERWATSDWTPVVLDTRDDFARAVAGYQRYDALLVNPVKDGLNLVAKEGPILNQVDGVLCLSPEAGAWDELGPAALRTHPYDLDAAAATIAQALTMPVDERAARAAELRTRALRRSPQDWLDDQLSHAR